MFFDESDTIYVKSKEEVFSIMGDYYGNAYYRAAIRQGFTKKELTILKKMLDEINSLGYNFSNLHKLTYEADLRFVPILLKYYDSMKKKEGILQALSHKEYYAYTPDIIELYYNERNAMIRFAISSTLFVIRNKKYVDLYLQITHMKDYIGDDMIPAILCKYHIKEFSSRFIDLYNMNPDAVSWNMANYGYLLNDRRILPILEDLANSSRKDISREAKKHLRSYLD